MNGYPPSLPLVNTSVIKCLFISTLHLIPRYPFEFAKTSPGSVDAAIL